MIKKTYKDFGLEMKDLRVPGNNRYRTDSLFYEFRRPGYTPLWSIKEDDHEVNGVVYPSLKKIYMEYDDPTEYSFAMDVFGSWKHWQQIFSTRFFQKQVALWREEMEIKLRSKGIRAVIQEVVDGKAKMTAAKYLSDRGWLNEEKKGRPSKKKIETEAKKIARIHEEVDEDLERMKHIIN